MTTLIALTIIAVALGLLLRRRQQPQKQGRKVIPINSPSKGKFLRKLEAKARREFPGRTEQWYRKKADNDLRRHRKM